MAGRSPAAVLSPAVDVNPASFVGVRYRVPQIYKYKGAAQTHTARDRSAAHAKIVWVDDRGVPPRETRYCRVGRRGRLVRAADHGAPRSKSDVRRAVPRPRVRVRADRGDWFAAHHLDWEGITRAVLIFWLIWWGWTQWTGAERGGHRARTDAGRDVSPRVRPMPRV
jgi:hypothetical protein